MNKLNGRLYVARKGHVTVFIREDGQCFTSNNLGSPASRIVWTKCCSRSFFDASIDWECWPFQYKIMGVVRDMEAKPIYPKGVAGFSGKDISAVFTPEFLEQCRSFDAKAHKVDAPPYWIEQKDS